SSPDYRATLVVVSAELFSRLVRLNTSRSRFENERSPQFHLTESQYADINTLVEALRTVLRIGSDGDMENSIETLNILTKVIDIFRSANETETIGQNDKLSSRLYEAIVKHCHQHHDVGFYADLFCLTPKYFSTLIRQETGHTVGHWVQQHLLAQAKIALRTEPDLRLHELSERLGFPDLAAFSRFFKRETGLSPSDFRRQMMGERK
ncbi:MAG: AraC family transcriptional regulator, partial [Bacteroidales bacterium]|nr:AraC family transcriptional regulator [Bacteroidales bacterium]